MDVCHFSFEDYRKLKVKLNLPGGQKVSAVTLSYIDQLWRSVAEEFDLPNSCHPLYSDG